LWFVARPEAIDSVPGIASELVTIVSIPEF
jgi:hypothetical protein